jgi:peptide-methionine (S)-S-oxide reductase
VVPFTAFYPAEEYHQDYFKRNPAQPYCQVIIAPKVAKFRQKYTSRLLK